MQTRLVGKMHNAPHSFFIEWSKLRVRAIFFKSGS